jgi:uncharacterized protein (DUF1697 family)
MSDDHHRYVALVRAINIGGKSVMKNEQLRRVFESVGCSEIVTHRQSGNAVFSTKRRDAKRLSGQLADELKHATGYATTVYVLAADELAAVAIDNPLRECQSDDWVCHLMFLSSTPDAQHRESLKRLQGDDYRFAVRGSVLYYAYPRRTAGRRRTINFERVLDTTGTARTATIIDELIELARG